MGSAICRLIGCNSTWPAGLPHCPSLSPYFCLCPCLCCCFAATKVEKLATNMDKYGLYCLVTSLAACCLSNCLICGQWKGWGVGGDCSRLQLELISRKRGGRDLKVNSHLDFELQANRQGCVPQGGGGERTRGVCVCVCMLWLRLGPRLW